MCEVARKSRKDVVWKRKRFLMKISQAFHGEEKEKLCRYNNNQLVLQTEKFL